VQGDSFLNLHVVVWTTRYLEINYCLAPGMYIVIVECKYFVLGDSFLNVHIALWTTYIKEIETFLFPQKVMTNTKKK